MTAVLSDRFDALIQTAISHLNVSKPPWPVVLTFHLSEIMPGGERLDPRSRQNWICDSCGSYDGLIRCAYRAAPWLIVRVGLCPACAVTELCELSQ